MSTQALRRQHQHSVQQALHASGSLEHVITKNRIVLIIGGKLWKPDHRTRLIEPDPMHLQS